jgi:hypothetical protein
MSRGSTFSMFSLHVWARVRRLSQIDNDTSLVSLWSLSGTVLICTYWYSRTGSHCLIVSQSASGSAGGCHDDMHL